MTTDPLWLAKADDVGLQLWICNEIQECVLRFVRVCVLQCVNVWTGQPVKAQEAEDSTQKDLNTDTSSATVPSELCVWDLCQTKGLSALGFDLKALSLLFTKTVSYNDMLLGYW